MNKIECTNKLRMYLADPESRIWQDSELGEFLDEALKQYCIDSRYFTGVCELYPDENGQYHFPDDYLGFLISWNENSQQITPTTGRELFVRSNFNAGKSGTPEYIYDDQGDFGTFSVYPVPENRQNINVPDIGVYGEIADNDYGVFLAQSYGTTLSIRSFDYSGVIYYIRRGNFEDIKDYMAIIYYALSIAYAADSELSNLEVSVFWQEQYHQRLNAFGRILYENSGNTVTGQFY